MKLLFAGTPAFAAKHLEVLLTSEHQVVGVITQPDKPGKRGKHPVACAVKRLADQHNLPVLQPTRLRLRDLAHLDADLMVVVAYGHRARQAHDRAAIAFVIEYGFGIESLCIENAT